MNNRRKVGPKSVIQFMVYHHSRANWLRKQKRLKEADQHVAEFQEAYDACTPNEKATFDFVSEQLGVPSFPNVKGYEPYPLPLGRPNSQVSKWFKDDPKQPKAFVSFPVPRPYLLELKEKTKHLSPTDRADIIRDAVAVKVGIKVPQE